MADSKDIAIVDKSIKMLSDLSLNIENEEDALQFMNFSNRLLKMAKLIDTNVRKRTSEFMWNEDTKFIENEFVEIKYVEPSEIDTYTPRSVIEALGIDRAVPFLKVNTGELKKYIRKPELVSVEELNIINKHNHKITKRAFLKITPKL